MNYSRNLLLVADIGYASPYWLDYCRLLQEEHGWNVKVVTPAMNFWQRKFFNTSKAGTVEVLETSDFHMFYRRYQGMPKYLRLACTKYKHYWEKFRTKSNQLNFRDTNENHIGWVSVATRDILKLHEHWRIDILISTCLPFETHLIASEIAQYGSIPWIADYRDPFSFSHTNISPISSETIALERKTLKSASACSTTSVGFSAAVNKVYDGEVFVLHNGFDELNVKKVQHLKKPINISYQGSIYKDFQDITIILDALDLFYSNIILKPYIDLPITIAFGGFSTHLIKNHYDSKSVPLPPWVELKGVVDFLVAKRIQHESDFLLLLNWEDEKQPGVMQTKLYEYISSGTPILSTGGSGKDETAQILRETNTSFHFQSALTLCQYLQKVIRDGSIDYNPDFKMIAKYSRGFQAKQLSEFLLRYI